MAHDHEVHEGHEHKHAPGCGHTGVRHEGHVDYMHEGHLHSPHEDHVDEHRIAVDDRNPGSCNPGSATGHDAGHRHGSNCGHEAIPHGDHTDYVVSGRLHHAHGDHCDDHGAIETV